MRFEVHDIGAASDFETGRAYSVKVDDRTLVVVRKGEAFYAMRDRCAHQGARLSNGRVGGTPLPCLPGSPVPYGRRGEILVCPWHGWEYDLKTGRALSAPDRARVRCYPARLEGDRVVVGLRRGA